MNDIDKIANELLQRLDKMADWVNSGGSDVFAIYVAQAQLHSAMLFMFAAFFFVLGITGARWLMAYVREYPAPKDRHVDDCPAGILFSLVAAFFGIGGLFMWEGARYLIIPEYYAIQELLERLL